MKNIRPTKAEFESRCQRMTADIRDSITSGQLEVGTVLPPESELTQKYQLSRNSVRKVLLELEQAKLIRRKQGQGSTVLPVEIIRKQTKLSEVVIISQPLYNVDNKTFDRFGISKIRSVIHFDAIAQTLHDAGLRSRLLSYRSGINDAEIENYFNHYQPTAVIILTWLSVKIRKLIEAAARRHCPAVSLVPVDSGYITNFQYDDFHMGVAAAEHVLDLGHRDIAVFSCTHPVKWANSRLKAFTESCHEQNCEPQIFLGDGDFSDDNVTEEKWIELGKRLFIEHLLPRQKVHPLVFCVNDLVAYGVIKCATKSGLKIKEDLSVMGCANDSLLFGFDMTSVNIETFKSGHFLAHYIIQRLSDTIPNLKSSMINVNPLIVNHTVTVKNMIPKTINANEKNK